MDFKHMKQAEIAKALGVTARTIQRWNSPRNQDGTYDLPKVFAWRMKSKKSTGSLAEIEKISKENLAAWRGEKAKMAELERRKMQGDYILATEVVDKSMIAGVAIREAIEAIPSRTAALLAAQNDQWECQQILGTEINHILKNLSDTLAVMP